MNLWKRWKQGTTTLGAPTRTIYDEDGRDIGRMDTPELAALVVEAVNEHLEAIESGRRVAEALAPPEDDPRACPTCQGSGYVALDPARPIALVKCSMCHGTSRVRRCTNCQGTARTGTCRLCTAGLVPTSEEI